MFFIFVYFKLLMKFSPLLAFMARWLGQLLLNATWQFNTGVLSCFQKYNLKDLLWDDLPGLQ